MPSERRGCSRGPVLVLCPSLGVTILPVVVLSAGWPVLTTSGQGGVVASTR